MIVIVGVFDDDVIEGGESSAAAGGGAAAHPAGLRPLHRMLVLAKVVPANVNHGVASNRRDELCF